MKILQVNCVYSHGSTGHIVECIHHWLLEKDIDSVVCYGRGNRSKDNNVIKTSFELYSKAQNILSRFTGNQYGGCYLSTKHLIHLIKKENPDIVHLHCINGYFVNLYTLIRWLNQNNYKTIITQHAEFFYTANCSHAFDCDKWINCCGSCPNLKEATNSLLLDHTKRSWLKMKDAFEGFNTGTLVSVSPWVQTRSRLSPITSSLKNIVIFNGVDTKIFHYYNNTERDQKYNKKNKVLMYVTPYFTDDNNHVKGGKYILQLANRLANDHVTIVVVGKYKKNMILPSNIVLKGYISNQTELAQLYSMADITLLVSRRETFSMVVAESLCCGTPVAGFKAGGPESIAIKDYTEFVENGDVDALVNSVRKLLNNCFDKSSISREAMDKYSLNTMNNQYYKLYLNAISE